MDIWPVQPHGFHLRTWQCEQGLPAPGLVLTPPLLVLLQSILGICGLPLTTSAGPNIPSSYYNRRPASGGWLANLLGGRAGRK